jgi:hypothetical protein
LNSYGFAPTAPSRPRVYLFHHLGRAPYFGRSGRIRTPDLRFWRPLLCQLSYTPIRLMLDPHLWCPCPDSNRGTRFRKPLLYPPELQGRGNSPKAMLNYHELRVQLLTYEVLKFPEDYT